MLIGVILSRFMINVVYDHAILQLAASNDITHKETGVGGGYKG